MAGFAAPWADWGVTTPSPGSDYFGGRTPLPATPTPAAPTPDSAPYFTPVEEAEQGQFAPEIELQPISLEEQLNAALDLPGGNAELDIDEMVAVWAAAVGATAATASLLLGTLTIMAGMGYAGYELAQFLANGGRSPLPPGFITGDPLGIWQDSYGYYHDSNSENPLQAYQFAAQAANSARPAGQLPAKPGSQAPSGGGIPMPQPGSQTSSDPTKGAPFPYRASKRRTQLLSASARWPR